MGMTRRAAVALWIVSSLLLLPGATCVPLDLPTGPQGPSDNHDTSQSAAGFADQVIEKVNAARAANGLQPLTRSAILTQIADDYATRMAEKGFFSHVDPFTGQTMADRADLAGYKYVLLAENIAAGQPTPQDVMDGWMNSPGHRKNILHPGLKEIGVGVHLSETMGFYWVQEFGTPQ